MTGSRRVTPPIWSPALQPDSSPWSGISTGSSRRIERLRAGEPTAVRVLTYYNTEIGSATVASDWQFEDTPEAIAAFLEAYDPLLANLDAMICRVATAHGAICVDLLPAFNGPEGRGDAAKYLQGDHAHPNAQGAETIAALIAEGGFAPIESIRQKLGPPTPRAPMSGTLGTGGSRAAQAAGWKRPGTRGTGLSRRSASLEPGCPGVGRRRG